jgi:hypothetical protein
MAAAIECLPSELFREPPEHCACLICFQVMAEPVQGRGCSHVFGRECLLAWLSQERSCPVCRRAMQSADLTRVSPLQAEISQLAAVCPHAALGCTAFFTHGQREGHLKERCAYVRCSQPACAIVYDRAAHDDHLRSCCAREIKGDDGSLELQLRHLELDILHREARDRVLDNAMQAFLPLRPRLSILLSRCRARIMELDQRLDAMQLPTGDTRSHETRRTILRKLGTIDSAAEHLAEAMRLFQDALGTV